MAGRACALRPGQRFLRRDARCAHDLHLRLLGRLQHPGRSAGTQVWTWSAANSGSGRACAGLDIGCGWGSFMRFAAERYGVQCTGATISAEQADFVRTRCAGLPIEVRLADYRDLDGRFDRIVSLGMFEHVGRKNHETYLRVAERCLADDGLLLLHTIGRNATGHGTDPWIDRYIFPNGEIPTLADIGLACEDRFVVEDLHNFGADYDRTLMAWHANFEAAWPVFAGTLGPRFRRMWRYYLLSCAGAFRARDLQLWQWVLSKPGRSGVLSLPLFCESHSRGSQAALPC
ncbi:Cyclopropane-fatty-acyl-phospholipid synthase [Ralstonia solanacearum UW551]|uniref:Cyclopropane-fatty-acyl-phospholipid synthase n=1 Tax=Ralstonia solanacearum (strain UW551) TaxID=342110 RepID=A0AB33VDQ2_RALSU|nr:class I SAM-dependent methyltransferase [Ralstonia solanacearum]EAP72903.1 Cyclopropane-fatty-acyl-phospholipid synthase [Ralstonia solanacearum UW551]